MPHSSPKHLRNSSVKAAKSQTAKTLPPATVITPEQAKAEMAHALEHPPTASAGSLAQLQRSVGNQAVQRLLAKTAIQTKLTVGPAGDKYEQEADKVASQVMAPSTQAAPAAQTQTAQKEPDE